MCYCDILWFKSEYCVRIVFAVIVFINIDAIPLQTIPPTEEKIPSLTLSPVPWVGVLLFKPGDTEINLASLILVHNRLAIANARDLFKIWKYFRNDIRTVTKAMFLTEVNDAWFATVAKIALHPEYNQNTFSTIGTVELEYDKDKYYYKGPMLGWPGGISNFSYAGAEIFVFGFTDRKGKDMIEQIVYRMDYVPFYECYNFYVDEKLNSRWMQPSSYHCYRVRFKAEPCVFDPGMALVHHSRGIWTLLGMSAWGPGCSLPSRFLDFEYFIPWVARKLPTRRNAITDWKGYYKSLEGPPPGDKDAWVLKRVNDTSITLIPISLPGKGKTLPPEEVFGTCDENTMIERNLMYRDRMNFTSRFKKIKGVGVYGLSLYDLRFNYTHYTCISLLAYCSHKSKVKLSYEKGFEQGDVFQQYIKKKPLKKKVYYRPFYSYLEDTWHQYTFEFINSDITNLLFRFQYVGQGFLEVRFYGNRSSDYDPKFFTTTTLKPTTTPRWIDLNRTTSTTTERSPNATTTTVRTTTNWWNKWWRYQSYPKVPGEDGGDIYWWQG